MEQHPEFTIESLLVRKDGEVTGPPEQMLFADKMIARTPYYLNRLAKVTFADNRILQRMGEEGLTSFSHYLIGCRYANGLWISLWVDEGSDGKGTAMCFEPNRHITLSSSYGNSSYIIKPERADFQKLFDHVFANPDLIEIGEG